MTGRTRGAVSGSGGVRGSRAGERQARTRAHTRPRVASFNAYGADPNTMTPEARLAEIGSILATAARRLSLQFRLADTGPQSVHANSVVDTQEDVA